MSGYAPDYIGQLIRKGRLPGKQVYCTVAWMTTEAAVRQYMRNAQGNKGGKLTFKGRLTEGFQQIKTWAMLQMRLAKMFRVALYFVIILSVGFSLLLFYIFSVSFDNKLQKNAIEKIEAFKK